MARERVMFVVRVGFVRGRGCYWTGSDDVEFDRSKAFRFTTREEAFEQARLSRDLAFLRHFRVVTLRIRTRKKIPEPVLRFVCRAERSPFGGTSAYVIEVNGKEIITHTSASEADAITSRLALALGVEVPSMVDLTA